MLSAWLSPQITGESNRDVLIDKPFDIGELLATSY
jgi:hypothetical protein